METLQLIIHDYMVLFAMVNAVGNLPIFADFTADMDKATRRKTFRVAVSTALSIVLIFAFFGHWMLQSAFHVSIDAFKIAGGILIFIVAAKGVLGHPVVPTPKDKTYDNVAAFPMAFPFLVGPGTIITTILLLQSSGSLITAGAAVLVYATILPLLYLTAYVEAVIGRIGVSVVTRILYIFICAKAVSFILDGLRNSFSEMLP